MNRAPLTRQIGVRLPDDLFERLEADAAASDRTVAQQVRHVLRRALQSSTATG